MSLKHFFPNTEGIVLRALNSLVARNPQLELDEAERVVYSKTHDQSKVSLVSGGGSGHEPAWSGYVGDGMLAAAVSGEVFASPATKQIMAAIKNVPSDAGVILCITNYTGDNLHFGLAREKALGMGQKVGFLRMAEDVALGRKQTENLGRRGLAGNMFILKLVGAASQQSWTFERCIKLGQATNDQLVTIGSSLDHCHIPEREHHDAVPDDACVLGMGIHNEPGLHTISPMPSAEKLVDQMLAMLLDMNDSDRAFLEFKSKDEVALLINSFGGLSTLETEAMTSVTLSQLENGYSIKPCRIFVSMFETSLNAPGFSITLCNLTGIANSAELSMSEILTLLDSPTSAPAWPKNGYAYAENAEKASSSEKKSPVASRSEKSASDQGPKVDPKTIERALRQACNAAIEAEPDITKYDIVMGDGDCGDAVVGMCSGILSKLDSGLCSSGSLFEILDAVEESVEEIGGSLGAIIGITVAAFIANLRQQCASDSSSTMSAKLAGTSAGAALENLKTYTGARVGGRTVMDALIPFCETLQADADLGKAVAAAEKGANSTANMAAKFGRASYIGDKADGETPPDPGAWAAAIFLKGLQNGLEQS
ncbi:Dak1 domain-containing protein [Cryomyces antarcticus]|nr:hypothetical protein LTR04_004433 [Oleoguttula sp. CCFEE 6159]